MNISPRMRQLLLIMLEQERTMSVQELADRMELSKRTVQRELEYISGSLKGSGVKFVSRKGSGVWLEGSSEDKKRLLAELQGRDTYDAGNRSERRKRLTLEILKEKGLKKLYYYSSKFKVSESTISGDLEEIQKWLDRYDLHVIRKPGSGIGIEGSEENYRRAIRAFVEENLDTRFLMETYEDNRPSETEPFRQNGFEQILDDEILKKVLECVARAGGEEIRKLTESSYIGLILHLTIAVHRMLNQEVLDPQAEWQEGVQKDEEYHMAVRLGKILEKEFEIEVPGVEISYIYLHLKAAKHEKIQWSDEKFTEIENRGFPQMVNEMIEAFDQKNAYWLKQDDEFLQGLLAHLQPTVIRILYHMQIENPVLDSVKEEYPSVYIRCENVAKVMEKWLGREIPEAEIGFLAIHFGAAMVRLEAARECIRQVDMGVVCSSGIGISRLMSTKLAREFRDRVNISVYGNKDITPYIIGNTDFFVSSIPLEFQEVPVIFVNPLLNETDMEKIRKLVHKFERTPKKKQEESGAVSQMEKIQIMAAQINTVVKHMECFRVKKEITFEELLEEIGKRMTPYQDLGEIIREDLRRREQITSQIFPEFGFGLLHARTKGVMRPSFALCLTEEMVPFSDPYMKKVSVIFVMLIPYEENIDINCEILGYISTLLLDEPSFMDTVLEGNPGKIQAGLSHYLKEFFKSYLSNR